MPSDKIRIHTLADEFPELRPQQVADKSHALGFSKASPAATVTPEQADAIRKELGGEPKQASAEASAKSVAAGLVKGEVVSFDRRTGRGQIRVSDEESDVSDDERDVEFDLRFLRFVDQKKVPVIRKGKKVSVAIDRSAKIAQRAVKSMRVD